MSNVSIVDAGAVPLRPSSPRKVLNLGIAAILGLLGGCALAFFLEYLDNTMETPEDVERRLALPALGVVPAFDSPVAGGVSYGFLESPADRNGRPAKRRRESSRDLALRDPETRRSNELIVHHQPRSVISEAYRAIRTSVLLSSADHPPQIILFTSGTAGEGKTVTAINQALTLTQSGGRVLLVDADIRKPRLHKVFGLANVRGLSTYLSGQSELEEIVFPVEIDGGSKGPAIESTAGSLSVIPSGPQPPNPAELLGSRRMRETLELLRQRYDYVVIDTPPVLPVTDAVILARSSDGVVLVVRGQTTPVDVATEARDRLEAARAKILGVVLNDVDVTTGGYDSYRRYYYSYYASSGGDEAGPA